jgi:hypothetical protein
MFSGAFEESGKQLTKTSKIMGSLKKDLADVAAAERAKDERDASLADDSDEETEDAAARASWALLDKFGDSAPSGISYVVIRDTPYKTYRALFQWLLTYEISFATLKSAKTKSGKLDLNASSKSVYRLCHQLGIDALKRLALANFESQLSSINVLQELFSTNCFFYPELRAAGLRVLEKNWQAVKAGGGLDKLLAVIQKDSSDAKEMMEVAIDILKRV